MEKLFDMFFLNKENVISGWFAIVFGFVCVFMTIIVSLPQTIDLIKTKKTGQVKYYSFWMFFVGILAWSIFGSFDPVQKNLIIVIANILSCCVYSCTLYLLYRYSPDEKRKKNQWIVLAICLLFLTIVIIIDSFALTKNWKFHEQVQIVFGQVVPIITSFAFLPQLLKSIEAKDFSGMSIWMIIIFVAVNIFWCCHWISFIINVGELKSQYTSAIIWQIISLALYAMLLGYTIKDKIQKKKQAEKIPDNDFVEGSELQKQDFNS